MFYQIKIILLFCSIFNRETTIICSDKGKTTAKNDVYGLNAENLRYVNSIYMIYVNTMFLRYINCYIINLFSLSPLLNPFKSTHFIKSHNKILENDVPLYTVLFCSNVHSFLDFGVTLLNKSLQIVYCAIFSQSICSHCGRTTVNCEL